MADRPPAASLWLPDGCPPERFEEGQMRSVPFDLVIYEDPASEARRSAARRRAANLPLPDDPAAGSHRSLTWLTGLARRRPAARARRAAG
jgi:hypothetical protein